MTISKELEDILKELPKTVHGQALIRVLNQAVQEMNDVSTIESYEEVLGRRYSLQLIKDLFNFMQEKKVGNTTNKNQYT